MIAAHAYPVASLQYRLSKNEVVETIQGKQVVRVPGISFEFKTVSPGFPTNRIRTRVYESGPVKSEGGRLLSKLDTTQVAAEHGIDEDELIEWLKAHPSYMKTFLFIDEEAVDVTVDSGYGDGIVANGDGSYTCTFCDKFFRTKQGIDQHQGGQKHAANREAQRPVQVEVPV